MKIYIISFMNREISIIKKDELYSFDEIDFICSSIKNEKLILKIKQFLAALENEKDSAALFFMPDTTFSIFSLIQGDNSICEISCEEINLMKDELESCENETAASNSELKSFLVKKLSVLADFLNAGNKVHPVKNQANVFEKIFLK